MNRNPNCGHLPPVFITIRLYSSNEKIATDGNKTKKTISNEMVFTGAPSGTRTLGPLIKSQLLYQLS